MTQIINSHNRKVKQPKKEESLSCNCRQKNDCPMDGKCRTMNTVYKRIASVPTKPDKSYIGLSEDEWKQCSPIMCEITVLPAYSNITKRCQLCFYEKYAIITYPYPEKQLC